MSGISEKQRMRDALTLTERNLSSLIGAKHHDAVLMTDWRTVVRIALGAIPDGYECICPKCGIRHGGRFTRGNF